MNWLSNNWPMLLQLLVLFGAAGAGAIGWVYNQLKQQSELRRAKADRERRELEVLRTGRSPDEAKRRAEAEQRTVAQRRLEQIAAQRRAQLEELNRRRQQQRRTPVQTGPHTQTQTRVPQPPRMPPGVRDPRMPMPPGQFPPGQFPQGVTPPPRRRGRAKPTSPMQPVQPPPPAVPAPRVPARATSHGLSGSVLGALMGGSSADRARALREAIILTEVLGKPVSERDRDPGSPYA